MLVERNKALPAWQGVLVLSIASVAAKVLSAAYRIPYQNMAGDLGFYVYQQIYPLYGIVMMLAMYGFPVALSKLQAELVAKGQHEEARQMMSVFFYGLLIFVVIMWTLIYAFADVIARIMGDDLLGAPIRATSYILFLLPFLAIGRGYHQGNGELIPTAVSHITEQIVRVSLILTITYLFVSSGQGPYDLGRGAAYGSVLGACSGMLVLLGLTKGEWIKQVIHPKHFHLPTLVKQNNELFKQSGFICLSAIVLVLFQLFDSFSVVRLLVWSGLDHTNALLAKGVYDRGQPLIQLGTVLATTLSLALVPMLSKALANKDNKRSAQYESLSYRLALLVGGAATIGLIVIMEPTNRMLFTTGAGSNVLQVLALAIAFNSLFVTLSAVLQGYQLAHFPAKAVLIGLLLKGAGNLLLIPFLGTKGAALATVAALGGMVAYLFIIIKRQGHDRFRGQYKTYFLIFLLLGIMGLATWIWKTWVMHLFEDLSRGTDAVIALSSVFVGGFFILMGMLFLPIFTRDEWTSIPKINKLRNLLGRRG
ncbi:polysaccharide biosynthesis protein [bacterium LRH843]|nr:polysaccharide biosynthesis protein [bacterium LRH843]